MSRGFTLPELLLTASVLTLLAGAGFGSASETLARQRVEAAGRRLEHGIEEARARAETRRAPCSLVLEEAGWTARGAGGLEPCLQSPVPLNEELSAGGRLTLRHNLPAQLRFTANGLLIDGGTVVISAPGTALQRCLVVALPLGVVRLGRYSSGGNGNGGDAVSSAACQADPGL